MGDGILGGAQRVRGDIGRKLDNALTMTFRSGPDDVAALSAASRDHEPTTFLDGSGSEIGRAVRVEYGVPVDDREAPDLWRADLIDASGEVCGIIELIRVAGGWSLTT